MIVTVDTNIVFQAFHSRKGASHQIFRMIRSGELKIAISVPVFQEYHEVLAREENRELPGLSAKDLDEIVLFIATVGVPFDIAYLWRPNLRDESDNIFVELAIASGSGYLITRNIRDFEKNADLRNDDIRIVTPAAFLQEWRAR